LCTAQQGCGGGCMKIQVMMVCLVIVLFISSCGKHHINDQSQNDSDFSGYVVKVESDRILVTSFTPNSEIKSQAIWVKTKEKIGIGNKVMVTFVGGLEASNPAQGIAKKIDIIKADQPEGTTMSSEEVITKALKNYDKFSVPVIKSVEYITEKNYWEITLFDAKSSPPVEEKFILDN